MALSKALEEAYAVADVAADILDTLEFDHPTLAQPLRFVRGHRVAGVYETELLPIAGNPAAVFTVVDFAFQRPGQGDGGTTRATIRIDNVSRLLQQALRAAISADQAFTVTYRAYPTADRNNPEVYDGLRMNQVRVNATSAEGDLYYEEIEMKAFPGTTYDLASYPALYGQ